MGLDIYFYRVANVRQSKSEPLESIKYYNDLNNKRAKDKFAKYGKRVVSKLENANSKEEYKNIYDKVFPNGIKRYLHYDFYYSTFIGTYFPIDKVKEFFEKRLRWHTAYEDAYFRKVNFLYHYFQPKLVDECCFVTKAEIEDIIERCDKILEGFNFRKKVPYFDSECSLIYKKIDLAKELLPTQSGFFFGSTDYNRWYFADVKNCKKQMKKLLKGFNEDTDIIFVWMSW